MTKLLLPQANLYTCGFIRNFRAFKKSKAMQSQLIQSPRQKMLQEIKTLLEMALQVYPERIPELNYQVLERLALAENWQMYQEIEFNLHELDLLINYDLETGDRLEYQYGIDYFKSLVKLQRRFKRLYGET
jgi:hypothetical protein